MYNVLYYQVVTQLCTTLSEVDCMRILNTYGNYEQVGDVRNIGAAMALVLTNMEKCRHLRKDAVDEKMADAATASEPLDLQPFELELQKLCLPFLRVAALLRHHIYHQELPHVAATNLEFARLVYFLELVTVGMDWSEFDATKALCFAEKMSIKLPIQWCSQLLDVPPPHHVTRDLILQQHVAWQQPRLLRLPREYERLFTYYHEQVCPKCQKVPKESSICLLCGAIVCLKQACCKEDNCCEAVRHSITCGGGTCIFLVVTSTYIIIIRGRRACLWGSLYLDDYDEEDRDLKRGKPLYLSEDRFNLLESQWISHRFAHTKHTWVWHRESL
ncbi:E3 ubiquitin-protein ligase Ubr3-like [Culicoides brevitarsis]|uniref:E3 ubiquitin-protein ligase Ubr3-like n=1 Tax=Culicoides brevitarsis TaxID=469753 RepID=UPI00307B73B0